MPYADREMLAAAARDSLERLLQQCHGIRWACVATKDGMEIASLGAASGAAGEKLSVMVGTMLALADGIVGEASLGACTEIMIGANQGRIVILGIHDPGEELVLAALSDASTSLGMVLSTCGIARNAVAAAAAETELLAAE
jgi:predicted regulator of Ras-like GTPase activity (Roadblock/LC7/MglB family)